MITRAERSRVTAELFEQLARTSDDDLRRQLVEQVVLANRGVAEAVASRYRGRGVPAEDLTQIAYEGLAKAAARYDGARGHDFLTFAVPTIRGEVQRYFRDRGWVVRPPRRLQDLQWRIGRTVETLAQSLGREPSHDDVAAALGVSREEYDEALAAYGCFQPTSLDLPVHDESATTLGEMLPGDDDALISRDLRLIPLVRRLPERDRRLVWLRFYEDRTQAEIGAELGVTQMQVSRLLRRVLTDLKRDLGDTEELSA